MLRPERLDVDIRRGYVEVVPGDHVEEENQVQNDDVEVIHDERRDVDFLQLSKTMSKRTMKLAKSRSEVVARCCRPGQRDLVEEDDVEEVVQEMVMCRCGGVVLSLYMGRVDLDGTRALLPC